MDRPLTLPETKVLRYTRNDFEPPVLAHLQQLADMTIDPLYSEQVAHALCLCLDMTASSWRRPLKALIALDYVLHVGAGDFAAHIDAHAFAVCAQAEDARVREKANEIAHLLEHANRLAWARRGAAKALGLLLAREFGKESEPRPIPALDGLSLVAPVTRFSRGTTASAEDYRTVFEDMNVTDAVTLLSERPVKSSFISDVYRGQWSRGGEMVQVAVKVVRATGGVSERALQRHVREISLWHAVAHENILPLLGLHWGLGDNPALVSPWCESGDINTYLQSLGTTGDVDLDAVKLKLLGQVLQGLVYLHNYSPKIIHGDIKGANVLVSEAGVARLCDFGLASVVSDSKSVSMNTTARGTLRWMAPELFHEDNAAHSTQTDIWAFGCLVLEVQSRMVPYHTLDNESAVIRAIYIDNELTSRPKVFPDRLWWLVLQTWAVAPDERPSAGQLAVQMKDLCEAQAADPSSWYRPSLPAISRDFPPAVAYRTLGPNLANLLQAEESQSAATLQGIYAMLISDEGLSILEPHFRRREAYIEAILQLCVNCAVGIAGVPSLVSEKFALVVVGYIYACIGVPRDQRRHIGASSDYLETAQLPRTRLRALVRLLSRKDGARARWMKQKFGPVIPPIFRGHTATINCIQYTPDGRRIISGSDDETIRFWDLDNGACDLGPLRGHSDRVTCLAVSPDGRRVVSGAHDRTLRLWDAETGMALGDPLLSHESPVSVVAFSSDGARIASGDEDGNLYVWALDSTPSVVLQSTAPGPIRALSFTTLDGSQLISLAGGSICTRSLQPEYNVDVDLHLGDREFKVAGTAIGFGNDTVLCALGFSDGDVHVVDVRTGSTTSLSQTALDESSHVSLAFFPPTTASQSVRLVTGFDGWLQIWDVTPTREDALPLGQQIFIGWQPRAIAIHPEGEEVAMDLSDNHTIFLYEPADDTRD